MKLPVKVGLHTLEHLFTLEGAMRFAKRSIPADLKKVGFEPCVTRVLYEPDSPYYRITYGKKF